MAKQKSLGLIVGNGLAIDLAQSLPAFCNQWHPQRPLRWTFAPQSGMDWRTSFPALWAKIEALQSADLKADDFTVLSRVANSGDSLARMEARHFLAVGFSYFQRALDPHSFAGSAWCEWIRRNEGAIGWVMSFNYDLIIETVLKRAGASIHRIGLPSEHGGIPVLKPHGSIDFAIPDSSINTGPARYPMQFVRDLNNTPIRRVRSSALCRPRTEALAILPFEVPQYYQRGFQWLDGISELEALASESDRCVILGHADGPSDSSEVDRLLMALRTGATVTEANPQRSENLKGRVEGFGKRYEHWLKPPVG